MKAKINNNIVLLLAYVAFLVVTLAIVRKHEPWIDEIYAWQISKFSIGDIIYEMRYEGHFVLWYWILYPFSHLGFPLQTIGVISWAINALTIFYLFWKSPFQWWAKMAILLAIPFLYINPAISRCYVLIPLFLFILAHYYRLTRDSSLWGKEGDGYIASAILLALLANTHIYIEGFVGIVSLVLLVQICKEWKNLNNRFKRRRILALGIIAFGVCVAFLQIYPSLESSSVFQDGSTHSGDFWDFFVLLISRQIRVWGAVVFIFIAQCFLLKQSIQLGLVFFVSNLFMVGVCVLVYGAAIPGRSILWFYYLIFCLWVSCDIHQDKNLIRKINYTSSIFIVIFSLILFTPQKIRADYNSYYSEESIFAYYIRDHINDKEPIYSNPNGWSCVIMEYLPQYHFYNIKDMSSLYPRKDRLGIDSAMATNYIDNIFKANPNKDHIYIMDCTVGKPNYMERYKVPYEYTTIYPETNNADHNWYFLKYYLIKINRCHTKNIVKSE